MTDRALKQLVAERSRAMATVILTRRNDLTIVDAKSETGLDFHVFIDREDDPMRLMFGVLLRGVVSPVDVEHANKILLPTMGQFQRMRGLNYPVCLFLFTMREDQEFFTWLAEPRVTKGDPKLIRHKKADCAEFTNDLLDQIVERVVAWNDAGRYPHSHDEDKTSTIAAQKPGETSPGRPSVTRARHSSSGS